jgi:hypothetical protein
MFQFMSHASPMLVYGFIVVVLVVAALGVILARQVGSKSGVAQVLLVALWLAFTAALAATGKLSDFSARPPLLVPLAVLANIAAGALSRSKGVERWLASPSLFSLLVALQIFRLPLELLMHRAAAERVMPSVMSYSGYNFDILTGTSALLLTIAYRGRAIPTALLWVWNCVGMLLLLIVVSIAVASTPTFLAFGFEQANTWIAHAPFVWLPTFLVPVALFSHLVLFRGLRRNAT